MLRVKTLYDAPVSDRDWGKAGNEIFIYLTETTIRFILTSFLDSFAVLIEHLTRNKKTLDLIYTTSGNLKPDEKN